MAENDKTLIREIGKRHIFANPGADAIIYRVELVGAGYVEFPVPPGGQFTFLSLGPVVNLQPQHIIPGGVRPLDQATDNT